MSSDDVERSIDICTRNNVRFFVVVMTERGLSTTGIVESFRTIAAATGGGVFEGVTTDSMAATLAASLATTIQGAEPCTVMWDAWPLCPAADVRRITYGVRGVDTVSIDYPSQWFEKRQLTVSPT
ncbi:MAG: hypothetical protein IPI29_10025 [Ignavibacteria bacterium]|nr:hypothetical protein [Ignavibacteria bacterium]